MIHWFILILLIWLEFLRMIGDKDKNNHIIFLIFKYSNQSLKINLNFLIEALLPILFILEIKPTPYMMLLAVIEIIVSVRSIQKCIELKVLPVYTFLNILFLFYYTFILSEIFVQGLS